MPSQAHAWSRSADNYDNDFIDPYRPDVRNPIFPALDELAKAGAKTVADLGCGAGPLLPTLSEQFKTVFAVDFADGLLKQAKKKCRGRKNITFKKQPLTNLKNLEGKLDVAVAVNSLVMPDIRELEKCLSEIYNCLKPGGTFLAILPAMDAVHYDTMLLLDRALASGKPQEAAQKNAAYLCDHDLYDFAFGQFTFKGIKQHFWQPFEIRYRLKRAGFSVIRTAKVTLSWEQFACAEELKHEPPPWDWFAQAVRHKTLRS